MNDIIIRGAREHNLKGIDVTIPRDKLVVVTGVSGSGKSSLAFDTLYAEGQRRYVESLSAYARQFLQQNKKPDVDHIDGLSPAIAIEQKSSGRNPRSTVGTLTEIHDYLRLLYARCGVPYCYRCGKRIEAQTVQQMTDRVLELPPESRVMILSPIIRGKKGEHRKELEAMQKDGFVRVRIDRELCDLSVDLALDKKKKHDIELVVDRLVIKPEIRPRLTDAIELALKRAHGVMKVLLVDGGELLFSERFACDDCGLSYPEIEPRLFSFNNPSGACPSCSGLGKSLEIDPALIVPDESKSIADGALAPLTSPLGFAGAYFGGQLATVAKAMQQSLKRPWRKLDQKFRDLVLYGSGGREFEFEFKSERHHVTLRRPFAGIVPELHRKLKETTSEAVRAQIECFMTQRPCAACGGARLLPAALAIKIGDRSIAELCELNIHACRATLAELALGPREASIAAPILREIDARLCFLLDVGLGYLSLARAANTLSGGEAQRIRLATQIGSALRGVIYVLDEPSIGLHQRDNERLLASLERLRDLGNTVVVVEHDEGTMLTADHIIDMGPGAGANGGEVVAAGTAAQLIANPASLTGAYLGGKKGITLRAARRAGNGAVLTLRGARGNNLKDIDVTLPLGTLVCVTGVSGSGKSTLVNDTLIVALMHKLGLGARLAAAPHAALVGHEHLDKVIDIDQSPIGRTPRSNPATYIGLFSLLRDLFAELQESRARGYGPGRYSFNVKGGRCEACQGDGVIKVEMHFLADVYVTCEHCHGRRYNRETLEVTYRGKNIAEVLELTVDEAAAFFSAVPAVSRKLATLQSVGLGYAKLGQSATTLSGGEAQRIKLSRELSRRATGRTLYVLDEPTTGLHFDDVERLLRVLHELVDQGNTVLVIEHNLEVIKTADHIIDLGPEGGDAGGYVLITGTPEEVAACPASHTGRYLSPVLAAKPPSSTTTPPSSISSSSSSGTSSSSPLSTIGTASRK